MLFYFVRHGETEANRQELLAGAGRDNPLNEKGHEQAKALAGAIQRLIGHPVHRLLVSDMTRTRQTAAYLSIALALPLQIVPEFREWHLGEWEGKSFADFGHLLLGEGEPESGEKRQAFYARISAAWSKNHSDHEPYVLVSHGAVWLALQDILKIPRFKIENCQLLKIHAVVGSWKAAVL
jgi:probable phosphoglycerate mutase